MSSLKTLILLFQLYQIDCMLPFGALPISNYKKKPHFAQFLPEGTTQPTNNDDPAAVHFCPRGCRQWFDGCDFCLCSSAGIIESCTGRTCNLYGFGPSICISPNCMLVLRYLLFSVSDEIMFNT